MPVVTLTDRTIVSVSGVHAEHLLQNIITTDLDKLGPGEAKPGALLTPQGKILFDFLVSRDGADAFRLDVRKDVAADFQRRLMLYRLRAKADISVQDQAIVSAAWENESDPSQTDSVWLRDARFPTDVWRVYQNAHQDEPCFPAESVAGWDKLRIETGIAESGPDYALSDAFPHDVLLDQMDGIGMQKGCYIGQEVVSRMHHRGTARRRVLIVDGESDLPASGADIRAGGKSIGTLGSSNGRSGLAIARIDRVKDAVDAGLPITVDDVSVKLSIPGWARFTFPESPDGDQA